MDSAVSAIADRAISAVLSFATGDAQMRRGVEAAVQKLEYLLLKIDGAIEEAGMRKIKKMSELQQLAWFIRTSFQGQYVVEVFKYPALEEPQLSDGQSTWFLPSSHNPAKRICTAVRSLKRAVLGDKSVEMLDRVLQKVEMLATDSDNFISRLANCPRRLGRQIALPAHWKQNVSPIHPVEHAQIVHFLLQGNTSGSGNPDIALIFGQPRIGKSTLMDLALQDQRVMDHFPFIWRFDMNCIRFRHDWHKGSFKDMLLNKFGRFENYGSEEAIDMLQQKFTERAKSQRCLLVFNNVSDEITSASWTSLANFLGASARPGSKIVVIAQSDDVVNAEFKIRISSLTAEEYWFYFKQHAFGNTEPDHDLCASLLPIGRAIAEKLNLSFRSARVIGALLRMNPNPLYWKRMLKRLSAGKTPVPLEPWELDLLRIKPTPNHEHAELAKVIVRHFIGDITRGNHGSGRQLLDGAGPSNDDDDRDCKFAIAVDDHTLALHHANRKREKTIQSSMGGTIFRVSFY